MFRSDYEKSVVLLGPKGVGKTLISKTLAEKLGINKVVSTDFLVAVLEMYRTNRLFNFDDLKKSTMEYARANRINPLAPNQEELRAAQERDMEEYFNNLYETAQTLYALKPNNKINDLVKRINTVSQLQKTRGAFSENVLNFLSQCFILEFVEMYLSNVSEPIILDMGADLGVVYNLTEQEKKQIAPLFKQSIGQVVSKQKNMIEKFKTRIAFVPCGDYEKSADTKVGGAQNQKFLGHINDYIDFANIMVSADGFSYDISNPVYKTYGHFFAYEDAVRDKLKDKGAIANLCDEIKTMIDAYDEVADEGNTPKLKR